MKKTIILMFLLAVTTFHIGVAQTKLTPTEFQIDSLFKDWTDDTKPGIALGVLNNGKQEFLKNWGLANLEHNISIDNNSVFLFPDKSEQILAFSTLLLVDRNIISLSDNVGKFLPDLPSHIGEVTIDQLLNHNGGIASLNLINEMDGKRDEDLVLKSDFDLLISKSFSKTNQKVGDYQYVRTGLKILQLILESKTEMSFAEFAAKEIFEPLGMDNSRIAVFGEVIKNKAKGYRRAEDGFEVAHESNNYLMCDKLYSTTTDILKWMDNFWRPKIGNKEIWKKMDAFIMDKGQPLPKYNRSQFLGQHRYWKYFGTDKYYQIGMTEGYAAKTVRFPEHDLALVVLGNFGDYNGFLASASSDLYLKQFMTNNNNSSRDLSYNKQIDHEEFVGHYWDYNWESKAEVVFENDSLWFHDRMYNWKAHMKPIGEGKFFLDRRAGYVVDFEKAKNSKKMILRIPDQDDLVFESVSVSNINNLSLRQLEGEYVNTELENHCSLKVDDEGITLYLKRQQPIIFKPLSTDQFNSQSWLFSRMALVRASNGEVDGFRISNGLVKDLFFKKLEKVEDIN